tara:strand:- start:56 stop:850 length:795 start_codon:yes stop_codon:yes gene_type:complete
MKKVCRVIATYFGPRRNHNNENTSVLTFNDTIELLQDIVELENHISSGVKKDTIIVNHDFGNIEGKAYLDSINGESTLDGKIKILHRPFNNGIGGSFCSFNYAFEKYKNDYEYWHFNEDDYYLVMDGYLKQVITQLENDPKVAYVCTWRDEQTINNNYITRTGGYKPHAHGGCGGTHIKFLNEAYNKFGSLRYSTKPMNKEMIESIKNGNLDAFNSGYAQGWYRAFELDGEVEFTNVYKELGYELQNIESEKEVVYSVRHKRYY